ncbi:MAG: DUF4255 domain-containing protein [Pseudomonadota bacterium]
MIERALSFLVKRLDENLRAKFKLTEEIAVARPPVGSDGKAPADAKNRLILFLASISQDSMARSKVGRVPVVSGRFAVNQTPIHLSLDLIMAASFEAENYAEGLKILSHGIQFFQVNPSFSPINAPDLDPGISQLSLEMNNMTPDIANQVWGLFGGRYLPSVRYQMRTVTIDGNALAAENFAIADPNLTLQPAESHL